MNAAVVSGFRQLTVEMVKEWVRQGWLPGGGDGEDQEDFSEWAVRSEGTGAHKVVWGGWSIVRGGVGTRARSWRA